MALRPRQDDAQRRALLFGAHQRRPSPPGLGPGTSPAMASERESLEAANDAGVDGLRGRVGEMRHVRDIETRGDKAFVGRWRICIVW